MAKNNVCPDCGDKLTKFVEEKGNEKIVKVGCPTCGYEIKSDRSKIKRKEEEETE